MLGMEQCLSQTTLHLTMVFHSVIRPLQRLRLKRGYEAVLINPYKIKLDTVPQEYPQKKRQRSGSHP